ncbi:MAG: nitrogen fixation protein NifQ [Magnetococcales bacterium]|nr:nitrogen fixation protein NifQ [Magnetococcales bacterium]
MMTNTTPSVLAELHVANFEQPHFQFLNERDLLRSKLKSRKVHGLNGQLIHQILLSWLCDDSALPAYLGLGHRRFQALIKRHYPDLSTITWGRRARAINIDRSEELADIASLLKSFSNHRIPSEEITDFADLIAAACLGDQHLYRDLGLKHRSQLTQLMEHNFPTLFQKNIHNMKWKKFIYKQLCEQEGVYICRSPSCKTCSDFDNCFGPE